MIVVKFELNYQAGFSCSTTFEKVRKWIGGLSSEIWKTGDPSSSMSLAHPFDTFGECSTNTWSHCDQIDRNCRKNKSTI